MSVAIECLVEQYTCASDLVAFYWSRGSVRLAEILRRRYCPPFATYQRPIKADSRLLLS